MTSTATPKGSRPHFIRRTAGLAALSSLILMSLGNQASAQGMAEPAGAAGPAAWGQHGAGRMDPADMEKHIERRIDGVIRVVSGTPEQKQKLLAIAKATAADSKPLREQHMQARRKAMDLLAAPSIDRAALEQARVAEVQAVDALSKRMQASMIESAEVLTPEQRTKLAERWKSRSEGHKS